MATSIDKLPSRIGAIPTPDPDFYALLLAPAWAIPTTNPWALDHSVDQIFTATIGHVGPTGFEPSLGNQEVAFFTGACSGVFYQGECVPVFRWPFRSAVQGHNYKWIARGTGQVTAWATKQGGNWLIDHDVTGGVNDLGRHYIATGGGSAPGPFFPGAAAPRARSAVTLDGRPAQFKWCGAEALFYPVEQSPPT